MNSKRFLFHPLCLLLISGINQCVSTNNKIDLSSDLINEKSIGILMPDICIKSNALEGDSSIKATLLKEIYNELSKQNKNYTIKIIENYQPAIVIKKGSIKSGSLPQVDYLCYIPNVDIYRSFPNPGEGAPRIVGGNPVLFAATAYYVATQPPMVSSSQEIKFIGDYYLIATASGNILKHGKVVTKDTRNFPSGSEGKFPWDLIAFGIVNQMFKGTPFIAY